MFVRAHSLLLSLACAFPLILCAQAPYAQNVPGGQDYAFQALLTVGDDLPLLEGDWPTLSPSDTLTYNLPASLGSIAVQDNGDSYWVWVNHDLAGAESTSLGTGLIKGARVSLLQFDADWNVIGGKNLIDLLVAADGTEFALNAVTGDYEDDQANPLSIDGLAGGSLAAAGFDSPIWFSGGWAVSPDGVAEAIGALSGATQVVAASGLRKPTDGQTVLLSSNGDAIQMWASGEPPAVGDPCNPVVGQGVFASIVVGAATIDGQPLEADDWICVVDENGHVGDGSNGVVEVAANTFTANMSLSAVIATQPDPAQPFLPGAQGASDIAFRIFDASAGELLPATGAFGAGGKFQDAFTFVTSVEATSGTGTTIGGNRPDPNGLIYGDLYELLVNGAAAEWVAPGNGTSFTSPADILEDPSAPGTFYFVSGDSALHLLTLDPVDPTQAATYEEIYTDSPGFSSLALDSNGRATIQPGTFAYDLESGLSEDLFTATLGVATGIVELSPNVLPGTSSFLFAVQDPVEGQLIVASPIGTMDEGRTQADALATVDDPYELFPLVTVGDILPGGYQFPGNPDGLGFGDFQVWVSHANAEGGSVSLLDFDQNWQLTGGQALFDGDVGPLSEGQLVDGFGDTVWFTSDAGTDGQSWAIWPDGTAVAIDGLGEFAKSSTISLDGFRKPEDGSTVLLASSVGASGEIFMWVSGNPPVADPCNPVTGQGVFASIVVGSATIDGQPLAADDWICVVDENGHLGGGTEGLVEVAANTYVANMSLSAVIATQPDPAQPFLPGAKSASTIAFRIYDASANEILVGSAAFGAGGTFGDAFTFATSVSATSGTGTPLESNGSNDDNGFIFGDLYVLEVAGEDAEWVPAAGGGTTFDHPGDLAQDDTGRVWFTIADGSRYWIDLAATPHNPGTIGTAPARDFPVDPHPADLIHVSAGNIPVSPLAPLIVFSIDDTTPLASLGDYGQLLLALPPTTFEDSGQIDLSLSHTHAIGVFDDAAAEIIAFDPATGRTFYSNANLNSIGVLAADGTPLPDIDLSPYGDGVNSVAVHDGLVAVAVQADPKTDPGSVVFFDTDGNYINDVTAGALPDMLTFTPDGLTILVANEGEPGDIDPPGSVSIIDLTDGPLLATVQTADFTAWDGREASLRNRGVRIFPGVAASIDLEPEYIAVSPMGNTAFVTLQEANAVAVVDIPNAIIADILPLGVKDHSRGPLWLETADFGQLPLITNGGAPLESAIGQTFRLGGFSGLAFVGEAAGVYSFVTIPDRGPNPDTYSEAGLTVRPFALPDYQARIVHFDYDSATGSVTITNETYLEDGAGKPITGRSNLVTDLANNQIDEAPADVLGNPVPTDPLGGDFESINIAPDGSYWMVDEYRPAIYHFDSDGILIDRFIPQGTAALDGSPAGTYGTETLPADYIDRRRNRGFEASALTPDGAFLYAFIQTPLAFPDRAASDASDVIRVLKVDTTTGSPVAEYVYLLEKVDWRVSKVDKIGDAVWAGPGKMLVIERDSAVTPTAKKYIYEVNLLGATDVLGMDFGGETLEEQSADDLAGLGITPIHKRKIVNLPSIGYQAGDKPEGLAILPSGSIAVLNDNDFGLADESPAPDGNVALNPDAAPTVLGILHWGEGNRLDPSNKDGGIHIANHPIVGMYMPDAIDTFSHDGATYFITANEGDGRDFDESRGKDANLAAGFDTDDAALGRLKFSIIDGDLDGDGIIDLPHAYGARSVTIWDAYGNLVWDSSDDFELITAEAIPAFFNSTNDETAFDNRSDDKGPEPEAVTVAQIGGTRYAFVGLERVGGIVVYDITNPWAPVFVTYHNNRDFDADPTSAAAGDLAPEDLKLIPAAQSPTGVPFLISANEVSGTVSFFDLGIEPDYTLSIFHNNDGESKLLDAGPGLEAYGGVAEFAATLNALRANSASDGILTLSSGDNFLAGPAFQASLEDGVYYDAVALEALGYDAIQLGNHDFDFGPDVLADFIGSFTNPPAFLAANLDFQGEANLQALVDLSIIAPSTIVNKGGEDIGIVGAVTPNLPFISSPGGVIVDPDIAGIVQAEVDALIAGGVNKIILISHLQGIGEDIDLIANLTGVDIAIAGGGDDLLANPGDALIPGDQAEGPYPEVARDAAGNWIPVVTTAGGYKYIGQLDAQFDAAGHLIAFNGGPILIDGSDGADPDLVTNVTTPVAAFIADLEATVIATSNVPLDGTRDGVRGGETNLGNLVADAVLSEARRLAADFAAPQPDIALQNGGSIRNDSVIPPGDITAADTFAILPFSNFLTVVEGITPDELLALMENAVSALGGSSGTGRFAQIAGMSVVYDVSAPAGQRIISIVLDNGTVIVDNGLVDPLAPTVNVATVDFLARGGDEYPFNEAPFTVLGISYQQALQNYIVNDLAGSIDGVDYPEGGDGRLLELSIELSVEFDVAQVDETAGSVGVTISRNGYNADPLVVTLTGADDASVTIPALANSATTTVTITDNADVDGDRDLTVTANADPYPEGSGTVTVLDDDIALALGGAGPDVNSVVPVSEGGERTFIVEAAEGLEPYSYAWTVDGNPAGTNAATFVYQPDFDRVQHPAREDDSIIICTITDARGHSVSATWALVRVSDVDRQPDAPIISVNLDPTTDQDLVVTIDLEAVDPDGDAIDSYRINWRVLAARAVFEGDTVAAENTRKGETWEVEVAARTNPYGDIRSTSPAAVTAQLTVANSAPTATGQTLLLTGNTELRIRFDATDIDVADGSDFLTFDIDTLPGDGILEDLDPIAGEVTYIPDADFVGIDSISFSATDQEGASATADIDIDVAGWALPIAVTNGSVGEIHLGMHDVATDGFELGLDRFAPPAINGTGQADFIQNGNARTRDIIATADTALWHLRVDAANSADDLILKWNVADVPLDGLYITETDANWKAIQGGHNADMANSNTVIAEAGTTRWFVIRFGIVTFDLEIHRGWNAIALPIQPVNPNAADIFDGFPVQTPLQGYQNGEYTSDDQLVAKRGYYLHNDGPRTTVTITGTIVADSAIPVGPGWNLVGQVSGPPFAPVSTDALAPSAGDVRLPINRLDVDDVYRIDVEMKAGFGYFIFVELLDLP
jgi:2',3'-cyclic-nucleotide 2'-phosphodiesterase (5'-nucleotidase family)